MSKNTNLVVVFFSILALCIFSIPGSVLAQITSPNFKAVETYFGQGGDVGSSSANYGARQSSGGTAVGDVSGNNFDAIAGGTTPSDIFLELNVTGANVDLGLLDASTASYGASQGGACNCTFYVRTYLSSGYVVITGSQPPTNRWGNILTAKTTLGVPSSNPNVEEFGMNLVDNSSPNIGANPVNEPDNTFADGAVASGYSTPNQFKYVVGDIIASSPGTAGNRAVGKTNYTISYIAKPKNTTASGNYRMDHDIIVAATF